MFATTVAAFDQTLQKANVWLRDIRTELWWLDSDRAYHALRAVLHALRDRLTLEEAVNLGAQLPMILRGCYYEGWRPRRAPSSERTKAKFLKHVAREFRGDPALDYEEMVRAVFATIEKHVTAGEVDDVIANMPDNLRRLWPSHSAHESNLT
jgi:uncharacterized protein (DUF2267 family)